MATDRSKNVGRMQEFRGKERLRQTKYDSDIRLIGFLGQSSINSRRMAWFSSTDTTDQRPAQEVDQHAFMEKLVDVLLMMMIVICKRG